MLISLQADQRTTRRASMQFKQDAVQRAARDGVVKAALDFGISAAMLCAWCERSRLEDELCCLKNGAWSEYSAAKQQSSFLL